MICTKELENHEVIQPLFYSPMEKISLIRSNSSVKRDLAEIQLIPMFCRGKNKQTKPGTEKGTLSLGNTQLVRNRMEPNMQA